jgi:hypothetical protein
MKPFSIYLITAGTLLTSASYVSAHEGNTAATIYHYFSSPDHLVIFGLLATSAVLTGLYLTGAHHKKGKLKIK